LAVFQLAVFQLAVFQLAVFQLAVWQSGSWQVCGQHPASPVRHSSSRATAGSIKLPVFFIFFRIH
ncbi:MAG TPA: hypothetical protein PKB07_22230, partial [Flavilitoribacter sp.]|nr:hypothetical protein [Flavilitoribacter sp.]